jgi:hypothetical protein
MIDDEILDELCDPIPVDTKEPDCCLEEIAGATCQLDGESFPIGTQKMIGGVLKKCTAQGWVPV